MKKIRVGVLFGGKSAEHEVSLQSAKNVVDAIDREKYEVVLIGIDKHGKWLLSDQSGFLLNANDPSKVALNRASDTVALVPQSKGELISLSNRSAGAGVDVVFPILHGPFGEDGTVQGLLKLAGVPFVGASVLGSALGMDKDVMKRLLREAGLPVAKFLASRVSDELPEFDVVVNEIGLPFFVKPANMGSSVGVHKVTDKKEFERAVEDAFRFDRKILIEEFVQGREIECAVLGNEKPIASVVGEIVPQHEFYSYEAKYLDEHGALLQVPADLPKDVSEEVRPLAVQTFRTMECEGLGRVDFFYTPDKRIVVNEINTMPGFTRISMYPRLWEATGLSYRDLIDRLIQLAIRRFEEEKQLKTTRE
jgi:D-alanine-D-alanine ligase